MTRKQLISQSLYTSWILYGQKYKEKYTNIFSHIVLVQACFCYDRPIEKLIFTLKVDQDSPDYSCYYGWLNLKILEGSYPNSRLEHVWGSEIQCRMCLDYGSGEQNGEGVVVKLDVSSQGEVLPVQNLTACPPHNQLANASPVIAGPIKVADENIKFEFVPIRKIQW